MMFEKFPFQNALKPYYLYTRLRQSIGLLYGDFSWFCKIKSGIVCIRKRIKLNGLVNDIEIAAPIAEKNVSFFKNAILHYG